MGLHLTIPIKEDSLKTYAHLEELVPSLSLSPLLAESRVSCAVNK